MGRETTLTTKNERTVQVALGTIPLSTRILADDQTGWEHMHYIYFIDGWCYTSEYPSLVVNQDLANRLYVERGEALT